MILVRCRYTCCIDWAGRLEFSLYWICFVGVDSVCVLCLVGCGFGDMLLFVSGVYCLFCFWGFVLWFVLCLSLFC